MTTPVPKDIDIRHWYRDDRDKKVEKFAVTAVLMQRRFDPDNPARQLIHWRCGGGYAVGDNWYSTSIDTRKLMDPDPVVEVQFLSKPFLISSTAPYFWVTTPAKDFTTSDVYELLLAHNFNRYWYNGNGSGCLTWTLAVVGLLETQGYIPAGSRDSLLQTVAQARADPRYWVPDEAGATFF